MPKRGEFNESTNLYFWRVNCGGEIWLDAKRFSRAKGLELKRNDKFMKANSDYLPPSHEKEYVKAKSKEYREANKEKCAAGFRRWSEKNKKHLRTYASERYKSNPAFRAASLAAGATRRAMQRIAMKSNAFEIRFLYSLAAAISSGGVKHVVDHFLPINPKHRRYCGLTAISNLRIIPERENQVKKNKCPIYEQAFNGNVNTQSMQ